MEKESKTPLELLLKHPVAPVVGGVLLMSSYLTDEPQPPSIPDGLPAETSQQWMMIYNQNQQRFQRRMSLYKDLGMVLLGYASAQAVIEALPKHRAVQLQALPPVDHDAIRRARGAM